MKYTISALLGLLLNAGLWGQPSRTLLVKLNLVSLPVGGFAMEAEHIFTERLSGFVAVGSSRPFYGPNLSGERSITSPRGYGVAVGIKRYLGNGSAQKGFAFKPVLAYVDQHSLADPDYRTYFARFESLELACTWTAQKLVLNRILLEGYVGFAARTTAATRSNFTGISEGSRFLRYEAFIPFGLLIGVAL